MLLLLLTGCSTARRGGIDHRLYRSTKEVTPYISENRQFAHMPIIPPLIVIDAGHGGKDLGTHSSKHPHYDEKTLTLITAKYLEYQLRYLGYRTLLTRSADVFVPLKERAKIANEWEADAFISTHYNSAKNERANGIEVFYYSSDQDKERSAKSQGLAKTVLDQLVEQLEVKSRGVKKEDFAVIRETKMPAILIEGGFLTNPDERKKLLTYRYIEQLAWAVANGVDEYINKHSTQILP